MSSNRRRKPRRRQAAVALGAAAALVAGVLLMMPADADTSSGPARGDFDADGTSDLVYRNAAGQLYIHTGSAETMVVDTDVSKVKDVLTPGDLNGDGKQDVLTLTPTGALRFHTGLYASVPGGMGSYSTVETGWQIYNKLIAPGDMNGDSKPDLLARTPAGSLYFYPGSGDGSFGTKVLAGTGWQAYDEVIGAGDLNGDGVGDVLARTPAGALYRFAGVSGGKLAARVLVGASGWQQFNQIIGGGDWDGNGRTDLLVRDFSGALWFYAGKGNGTFAARVARSTGWQTATQFAGAGNNPQYGKYGIMARTTAGSLYRYQSGGTGTGALINKKLIGESAWPSSTTRLAYVSALSQNGLADLVVHTKSTGKLTNPALYATADPLLAAGSTSYNLVLGPGDLTGDGNGDLLARSSSGTLYLYPGTGTGMAVGSRVTLSAGWQQYNAVVGAGDFTGDGRTDIVARTTAGVLYLYKGTGSASAPFSARVKLGSGWQQYNKLFSPGDANGDGKADLMATTSAGALYFYAGTGTGTFKARVRTAASGWTGWADLL